MPLSDAERRANVDRVVSAAKELERVENALLDAEARIGPLRRTITEARTAIQESMNAAKAAAKEADAKPGDPLGPG